MNPNSQDIAKLIKSKLSRQLGIEPEDIGEEDLLTSDLMMKANDLADLLESLEEEGLDTSSVDFNDVESVGDLIEKLSDEV